MRGNPSKSVEVNELIKNVLRHECRQQGAKSRVKRAMTRQEFVKAIAIFNQKKNFQQSNRVTTMMKYQYHLIGRSDDIANFLIKDLAGHADPRFSTFALQTKVRWSKAVMDERCCPDQIFLGSFDTNFCLLVGLAIYLEAWMSNGGLQSVLLFSDSNIINKAAINKIKNNYSNNLQNMVFNNDEFQEISGKGLSTDLGSHSLRKFASTWAKQNGCTLDEIETRGRWKRSSRRTVDRYVNVDQPHIDAKVEAVLCVGGPIKYVLQDDSGVTVQWLKQHVVPGITAFYDQHNTISEVLALPLLWACFDAETKTTIPEDLCNRICFQYEQIRLLEESVNPVKRVQLSVYRVQELLCIDTAFLSSSTNNNTDIENNANNQTQQTQQHRPADEQMNGLMIQMQQTRQQLEAGLAMVNQTARAMRLHTDSQFSIVNRNISRVAIQPTRMATPRQIEQAANINNVELAQVAEQRLAQLSKGPKNLFEFWMEWEVGIGGKKAAKDFTSIERGACKVTYCRRKVVWDQIVRLVNRGYAVHTAIDKIYGCYGRRLSPNKIMDLMVRDKAAGGHANLP
jgi:hypothetical protein